MLLYMVATVHMEYTRLSGLENRTEGSAMLLNFVFKNLNCTTSIHTHLLLGNSGWDHEILWSMGVIMRYNNYV